MRLTGMIPSLASAQRLVVKIGSALVVDQDEAAPRTAWLDGVAADIASLRARGVDVIVVSSGAIALARRSLGLQQRRLRLEEQQAAAAVGQIRLAQAWSEALSAKGLTAAQLLLTLDDTEDRRRYLNARATLNTLLGLGCIPVINENDTVATAEIRFGDNDRLAARVAEMMQADQLVLLSDIDGLYTADPRRDAAAAHIPVVAVITPEIEAMGGEPPPGYSSGGMRTKLVGGAHRHAGRLCDGDRLSATPSIRLPRSSMARAAPGFSPHPKAAPRASAGSPVRWRRSVHWWWMPAPHARLPRVVRCCRPACAAVEGTFERGDPVVVRSAGRQGAGARPLRLCQRRCGTHRRSSLRRDRGDPRLARPRRDHPPRRPRLALNRAGSGRLTPEERRRCTSRPKPPSICNAPRRRRAPPRMFWRGRRTRSAMRPCVRWRRPCGRNHPTSLPPTLPILLPAPEPPHSAIASR